MIAQSPSSADALINRTIVITRPAGTGSALAKQVRARGGEAVLLPGLSLRAMPDTDAARKQWRQALHDRLLVFTSPAAVQHALALAPFVSQARVIAVGQGTARALRRHGIVAVAPTERQDSEGVLALAALQDIRDQPIALITAPGGRGVLREQLAVRGAVREVYVYQRTAPRLVRRHTEAIQRLPTDARVLLSSGEALQNLHHLLPAEAWARLCAATAVVSSERLAALAAQAGFASIVTAASAHSRDLLDAAAHSFHEHATKRGRRG